MTDLDFADDVKREVSPDTLKKISELAQVHLEISDRLAKYAKVAKELKERMTQIEAVSIPDLMEECKMLEYTLESGAKIAIKEIINGSIPSATGINKAKGERKDELIERRAECLEWLNEHGGGAIIKNEFVFSLGKGNTEKVDELKEFAVEIALPWVNDESVHAATLNAFIKEKLNEGEEIPFKTFSIYTGKIAKITQPKK